MSSTESRGGQEGLQEAMNPSPYTEGTLVQQTTAGYVGRRLSWETVYVYNHEDFGADSLLAGRPTAKSC